MNEIFAAEPTCFRNETELRSLLKQFGPYTGRYLAKYPPAWSEMVKKNMLKTVGDMEGAKIKRVLELADKERRAVAAGDLQYDWNKPWVQNALKLIVPSCRQLDAIVSADQLLEENVFTLDSLDIPPVAEEKMGAQPREFVRVVKTLVSISERLVFVDPYVNPCKDDVYSVLLAIFKLARSGCVRVTLFAREDKLLESHTRSQLQNSMSKLRKESALPAKCKFEIQPFNDAKSDEKVHARYLFSDEGGIRFDQGFQRLGKGKKVDVGPISPAILKHAINRFVEGQHDMELGEPLQA